MINYVLGFAFTKTHVVLIVKNKPEFQKGFLNGVGGKIEEGETNFQAMIREFKEETNLETIEEQWNYFGTMKGKDWLVDCFITLDITIEDIKSLTEETIVLIQHSDITFKNTNLLGNLSWLIGFGLDFIKNDYPMEPFEIKYNGLSLPLKFR